MANNEGWDSVFLQALQNSLAQSKAENKWNQELAFRDKEFAQKQSEFDWTKGFNEKQLEQARIHNLADYGTKFASLGEAEIADWNKNFGGMYGMGGDNPYTDIVENNWVPQTALAAKENTRQYEQKRLEDFFGKYSTDAPAYKYDTAQQIALTGKRLGNTVDTSIANKFGFPVPDPNAIYYLNDAKQSAGGVQGSLEATDKNNAAAHSRMLLQIANDNANMDKQTRGYYKVFIPGRGTVDAPNMTLSQIEQKYGKNAIIEKVPDNVGFSSSVWNLERSGLEKGLNTIKDTDGAIAFIEALRNKGIDVNTLPEVRSKLMNIVENESISNYKANPQENLLGQILGTDKFTEIPQSWRTLDYNDALNQGKLPDNVMKAKRLLGGMQSTGLNPDVILKGNY